MLLELQIRNYALIDRLAVQFQPGLNVLTGETGAGKSIIIGALSLVLGGRADVDSVRSGAENAVVEARFTLTPTAAEHCAALGLPCPDQELILSRRIERTGRSICHANGSPVTVAMLDTIGDRLVDLHGQHSHQLLLRPETHLEMLDAYGGLDDRRTRLAELWQKLTEHQHRLTRLSSTVAERRDRRELLQYHWQELADAGIRPNEAAELEAERQLLETAARRYELAAALAAVLSEQEGSIAELIGRAERPLNELAQLDPSLKELATALTTAGSIIDDVWRTTIAYRDAIEFSPERMDAVNSRLFLLERLARKHSTSPAELPALVERLAAELESIDADDSAITLLQQEIERLRTEYCAAAVELSRLRQRAARSLTKQLAAELAELGMAAGRLTVALTQTEDATGDCRCDGRQLRGGPTGIDTAEFLFSANPGEELRPLRKIASGGELSRIMLALKGALDSADPVPVLVFDEVDAGIGGAVADTVGARLSRLARTHQVICITHLPQIACYGHSHFRVRKLSRSGRQVTTIERLDDEQRIEELARMTAGAAVSRASLAHARELLAAARKADGNRNK